jgi:hypothetical protein
VDIYFGTVIRAAPVQEGGRLVRLDWDRKKVLSEVPIVPSDPALDHDPNERGNVRGCRGIQVVDEEVVAADYHTLQVFDRELNPLRRVSDGLMVGLHEIQSVDHAVWVTSTTLDAALKYDLGSGELLEQFWPREMPAFQQALGVEPLSVDKGADNRAAYLASETFRGPSHLHLNAVCEFGGETYALFHSMCVVANLSRGTIVIRDEKLKHAHNLIIESPGVAWINDTRRTVVRSYDLASGRPLEAFDIRKMPGIKALLLRSAARAIRQSGMAFFSKKRKATARPLYLRGLALHDDFIFAGFSPATIFCIDKRNGKLVDAWFHSDDMRDCIHGLAVAD